MKLKSLFFLLALASNAYAFTPNSWYVEPHFGLVGGSFEQDYSAHGTHTGTGITLDVEDSYADGSISGISFGSRLGYHWNNFFLAGDLRIDSGTYSMLVFDGSATSVSYSATSASLGVTMGYRFDMGVGIWFGLSSEALVVTDDDDNKETYTGVGTKVGLGYKWTDWALNLEFAGRVYDEVNGHKLPYTETVSGVTITSDELTTSTVLLSLSYYYSF